MIVYPVPILPCWSDERATKIDMQTLTFKNDPNRFDEVKKAQLKKWVPILIVAFGVGMYIAVSSKNNSADFLIATAPFTVIFAFIIVSIRSFSIISRHKRRYESYRLMIDDNAIIREQMGSPVVRFINKRYPADRER